MRIALQTEIPGLVDQLQSLAPGIEAFVLPSTDEPGERIVADALLGTAAGGAQLPALIERCEDLRWVHILGTGVDKFPLHLVEDKLVTCSRGATAGPIAEWVMAMLLAHEKQLPDRWITEPPQAWYMADLGCLENKTLGIIGFGAIGQAIAKRALAFDMNIIAKVRTHRTSPIPGVELVEDLHNLLQRSDHVVLALPSTPQSDGLMGAQSMEAMKPGAHLVNVSRANLIDQEALRESLDKGHIGRASLDVVEPEPLPAGHWIYQHPRVFLSPHISWSGPNMIERLMAPFFANVKAFSNDQPLEGVVDTAAGY
jgi:phosphoglycerate dehydrogenase-like enzyme